MNVYSKKPEKHWRYIFRKCINKRLHFNSNLYSLLSVVSGKFAGKNGKISSVYYKWNEAVKQDQVWERKSYRRVTLNN